MDPSPVTVVSAFDRLSSPEGLTQMISVILVALIALAAAQRLRSWRKGRPLAQPESPRWQAFVFEAAEILAPIILAIVLLLIVHAVFVTLSTQTRMLDAALQLATTLLIVRLAVYVLRQAVGGDGWLRVWE